MEYVIYCSGVMTVSAITVFIKNYYNIKGMEVFKDIDKTITSKMKKVESMPLIMDRKKYDMEPLIMEHEYTKANCFDKIPEDNKYVNLWFRSILNSKGQCASPNCVNMLHNKKELFMAFDSKFCSSWCRDQAQNHLGKYWNIGK